MVVGTAEYTVATHSKVDDVAKEKTEKQLLQEDKNVKDK